MWTVEEQAKIEAFMEAGRQMILAIAARNFQEELKRRRMDIYVESIVSHLRPHVATFVLSVGNTWNPGSISIISLDMAKIKERMSDFPTESDVRRCADRIRWRLVDSVCCFLDNAIRHNDGEKVDYGMA